VGKGRDRRKKNKLKNKKRTGEVTNHKPGDTGIRNTEEVVSAAIKASPR